MEPKRPTTLRTKQSKKSKKLLAWFFLRLLRPQPELLILVAVLALAASFLLQTRSLPNKTTAVAKPTLVKAQILKSVLAVETSPVATSSTQTTNAFVNQHLVTVPTLMYHYIQPSAGRDALTISLSVLPQNFDGQMNYLVTHGYNSISPQDLENSLLNKTLLPERPILLTFDDGYRDFYLTAYPILKKYHLKATEFIATGLINTLWYLHSDEIKQLATDPNITFAGHTIHHVDLTALTEAKAFQEISVGKSQLEALIGRPVTFFAYPYGTFNNQVINLVSKAGYKIAFTTRYGLNQSSATLLDEPRVRISGTDSLATFISKLSGYTTPVSLNKTSDGKNN